MVPSIRMSRRRRVQPFAHPRVHTPCVWCSHGIRATVLPTAWQRVTLSAKTLSEVRHHGERVPHGARNNKTILFYLNAILERNRPSLPNNIFLSKGFRTNGNILRLHCKTAFLSFRSMIHWVNVGSCDVLALGSCPAPFEVRPFRPSSLFNEVTMQNE